MFFFDGIGDIYFAQKYNSTFVFGLFGVKPDGKSLQLIEFWSYKNFAKLI